MRAPTASQCAMSVGVVGIRERREAEQPRMVAEPRQQVGFAQAPVGGPADAADADQRLAPLRVGAIHLLARERSTGSKRPTLRIANGELRRVHADGQAAGAGRHVVARQRALPALVEPAVGVERQRMRGNDPAAML